MLKILPLNFNLLQFLTLHFKTDVVNSMITPKDGKGHRSRMLKSGQVGRKKERTATQGERSSQPSHGLAHDYHGGPELAVNSAEDYSQDSFFVTLVRLTSSRLYTWQRKVSSPCHSRLVGNSQEFICFKGLFIKILGPKCVK